MRKRAPIWPREPDCRGSVVMMTQAERTGSGTDSAMEPTNLVGILDSDSTFASAARLVGADKRVLQLGCGAGAQARALVATGCRVVGVEKDPQLATQASSICERVVVGDVEHLDLAVELGADRFDVILAVDVLQHTEDAESVVCRLKGYLNPKGALVVSVPNVAHASVRLALLAGSFPYAAPLASGRRPIRFFTRDSVEALLSDAGFLVGHLERRILPVSTSTTPIDKRIVPPELVQTLADDPDATAAEFILVAYALPPVQVDLVQSRVRELRDRYEGTLRAMEGLRRDLDEQTRLLDALRDRAETATAQETRLTTLLAEAHQEILRRDAVIEELGGHAGLAVSEARNLLEEQREWAERSAATVVERDATIRHLQDALAEQTAWAQRLAAEIAHRDAIIHQLQASAKLTGAALAQLTLIRRILPEKLRSIGKPG